MYKLILVVLFSTVIFISCDEKLPTGLYDKTFTSFEDVKSKINSGEIKGYVSSDSNKIFFIMDEKYDVEGQFGYVFTLKKGDKNVPAEACYTQVHGIIKVEEYKNVILAMQGSNPGAISSNSLYIADEHGNYNQVGYGVADFEVLGNNIYLITDRDILVYNGSAKSTVKYESVKGEGGAELYYFTDDGKNILIYKKLCTGEELLYPMSFRKITIEGKKVLTADFTDGKSRIIPTNTKELMEVIVRKIRKQSGHENQTEFTNKELDKAANGLTVEDLKTQL